MVFGLPSSNRSIQFDSQPAPLLFSPELRKRVHDLCGCIVTAVKELKRHPSNTQRGGSNSLWSAMVQFFSDDEDNTYKDHNQKEMLLEYLEKSCIFLSELYDFPEFQEAMVSCEATDAHNEQSTQREETLPEYRLTNNGVQLTDVGRYQIANGIRRFTITYSGDPELQPVRTYESLIAVKLLYWMACRMNRRCELLLHDAYNRPTFMSRMLRSLSQKLKTNRYHKTPFTLPPSSTASLTTSVVVSPRISLRFAASYYFLGRVGCLIVLARMCGCGWMVILLALLVFIVLSIIVNVDSPPKRFDKDK